MKDFFNKFTNRMVMGEIIIHALLASFMFLLVLPLLEEGYEAQFIRQTEYNTTHIASMLANRTEPPVELIPMIKQADVVHARLAPANDLNLGFKQESELGTGGDNIFQITLPMNLSGQNYVLELGYDETATNTLIANAYNLGFYVVIGYIFFAALIAATLGPQLTRPLQQLRLAARQIASGLSTQRLDIHSGISEIKQLSSDLELMRNKLVTQHAAITTREARIRAIMDNVIDALITIDEQGRIQSFNLAAERIFDYQFHEVIDQNINILFASPIFPQQGDADGQNSSFFEEPPLFETLGKRKDGKTFYMETSVSEVCEIGGCLSIVVCRDISGRKHAEMEIKSLKEDLEQRVVKRTLELATVNKELQHQALHDALTGLPNRVLMQDRLQQATRAAKRDGHALALMITDLDRFKEINDTLGHHYGDLLLQQVAVRMRSALRDSDTVARLGGDEFAVLLPSIENEEQAAQAATKIAKAMESPFILENQHFHVGISIGIALYPDDGETSAHLMRRADVAMYVAKRSQHDYAFYSPDQDQHSVSRLSLVSELRQALEEKQLHVCYQPSVDLITKEVMGVEALLRWEHPEKGAIPPDEFIPLAEHTGLIKNLTMYVLNEALQQLHLWRNTAGNLRMAINLSVRNLHDQDLVLQIANLLERWQILPQQLQMEITESAIMEDPSRAMSTLSKLNSMGIKLSIDDFGTGYSSLSYLKQLPVHEIKIDKSFVQDMLDNNEDQVIVRSTIDLAHNMGHKVIAEGINSEEALNLLKEMGCDLGQGFHISAPMKANTLLLWLKQNTQWSSNRKAENISKKDSQLAAI